jgi:hypothetical protein
MKTLNNMPTDHAEWAQLKKDKNIKTKVLSSLNRFQFRYRLACSFSSMTIDGTTPKTANGYTAFMKLFLAYSAYDEVRVAEMIMLKRKKPKVHSIENQIALAATLRKNTKLKILLTEGIANQNELLKKRLHLFFDGKSDDVMCVATAARNSFVHGDLTAGGSGLSIKARVAAIEELAHILREYSDKLFSKCIKNIDDNT